MATLFFRDGTPAERHSTNEKGKPFTQVQLKCSRCGGAGGADKWRHTGWKCYDCGGAGLGKIATKKLYTAEQLAKLNDVKAKKNAKRQAEFVAKADAERVAAELRRDAFLTEHKELLSRLRSHADGNEFLTDILTKAMDRATITDNQLAAVIKVMDRIDARDKANAASEHAGQVGERLELAVTVTNTYAFERQQAVAMWLTETVHIITMQDSAGHTFVAKGTRFYAEKGATLTIKGTVKAHDEYKGCKQTLLQRIKVL